MTSVFQAFGIATKLYIQCTRSTHVGELGAKNFATTQHKHDKDWPEFQLDMRVHSHIADLIQVVPEKAKKQLYNRFVHKQVYASYV